MNVDDRISEIQSFLRFVSEEWPALRLNVANQLAKRCARCILSEKCVPLIDGICEPCIAGEQGSSNLQDGTRDTTRMERQLNDILNEYSGKGAGNYDALVLFSGGKDSAFLLQRLCSDFPSLRLLAVTVDNGFFSQVAMANCRRTLQTIDGVDHMVFKPEKSLYIKTFRYAFTHLNEGGCYTTVDRMDGDLTFDIGRNLAASFEIPLLIAGLSPEQVERILGLNSFETPAADERETRTHSAGFRLTELYSEQELRKYWWHGGACPERKIPRVLYPYYAWDYDEEVIRRTLIELKLIDAGHENPLVTNNDTIPLMLAVDVAILGYSGFEPEFARLIRNGKADRAPWLALFEALEYLCSQGRFLPRSIGHTLNRLHLKHTDLGLALT